MNSELIQLIHIVLYRLEKSMQNAHEDYFDFKAGNDSRSPSEILSHLVDVGNYGLSIMDAKQASYIENSDFGKIKSNFLSMQSHLLENEVKENISRKLINGPLSDTLTHIGQLTLLRRLQGNPIEWENYTNAEI